MKPICQICGYEIKGKAYYWDDDPRLPMHKIMTECTKAGCAYVSLEFAGFMNRNIEFINGRGEPVLRQAVQGSIV